MKECFAHCQSLNGMHPQSKLTVCSKDKNVRYRPEAICGHFIKAEDVIQYKRIQCTPYQHKKNI